MFLIHGFATMGVGGRIIYLCIQVFKFVKAEPNSTSAVRVQNIKIFILNKLNCPQVDN